jgi:hypothetical protein
MRGSAMQRLKHAGGFLVSRESLEANPAPLNDKAGNFAGVGEYGLHGLMKAPGGIVDRIVERAAAVPLGSQ